MVGFQNIMVEGLHSVLPHSDPFVDLVDGALHRGGPEARKPDSGLAPGQRRPEGGLAARGA